MLRAQPLAEVCNRNVSPICMFVSTGMISMSPPTPPESRDNIEDHRCNMACWVIVILLHTETNLYCLCCTHLPSSAVYCPIQFLAGSYCGSNMRNSTSPYRVARDSVWFCKPVRSTVLTALGIVGTVSKCVTRSREYTDEYSSSSSIDILGG